MDVTLINMTPFQQFIDKVGVGNAKDIITLPANGKIEIDISEKQLQRLLKKLDGKVVVRKGV